MQNISQKNKLLLLHEYGIDATEIRQITTGVGGDTFLIDEGQEKFIYKIADKNEMNHPEAEPEICDYLYNRGIEVSRFIKNRSGKFVTPYGDNRVSHVQKFISGTVFSMNEASQWFMAQSPILLGKIHRELRGYKELPMGIGEDFFRYMTPETVRNSYLHSYEVAKENGQTEILEDLEFRINFVQKMSDWKFNLDKLPYCNSHGDYTVNQIICGENQINAVIDWTCACRHPVIWELTRSFFYAEPTCAEGKLDEKKFEEYVESYCSVASLTQYDRDSLLKLYFYQLAVCDYYAQYFGADEHKKEEYLVQARFATKVLRNADNMLEI